MARTKKHSTRTSTTTTTTATRGKQGEEEDVLAARCCDQREGGRRVRIGDGDIGPQLSLPLITKRKSDEAKIGGDALKEKGNAYFKRGDYAKAVDAYTEALTVCEPRSAELLQLRRRILCNRSAASLRVARSSSFDREKVIAATSAAFEDAEAVLVFGTAAVDLWAKALLRKAEAQITFWRLYAGLDDIFLKKPSPPPSLLRVYHLEHERERSSPIANSSLVALRNELCVAIQQHLDIPHSLRLRAGQILASMHPPSTKDRDQAYLEARRIIKQNHDIDITRQVEEGEEEEEEECGGDSNTTALPDSCVDGNDDDDQDTVVDEPPEAVEDATAENDVNSIPTPDSTAAAATE